MRECNEYEITVEKFIKFTHGYTERAAIKVVTGPEGREDHVKDFYLSENIFADSRDGEPRLLQYYADVPLWNLHVEYEYAPSYLHEEKGHYLTAVLVANCHYMDIREAYKREKEDIRKEKRREYDRKRRENKGGTT